MAYQKITDKEKDLSLRCKNGKEFFERHTAEIGGKDLNGIARIWSQRSKFRRERGAAIGNKTTQPGPSLPDLETLITDLLNRIAVLTEVQKDIAAIQRQQLALFEQLATASKNGQQKAASAPQEADP